VIAEKVAQAEERQRGHISKMNKLKRQRDGRENPPPSLSRECDEDDEEEANFKLEEDFSDIYAFQSPTLYFR
jgi:hypothetical protein